MRKLSELFDVTIAQGIESGLYSYDIACLIEEKTNKSLTLEQFNRLEKDIQAMIDEAKK